MPISTTITSFMTNSLISPTFTENTPIILDKDYAQSDPFCNPYLTKNAIGGIIQCGLSKYTYDPETNSCSNLVDGEEWCFIELSTPRVDFDNSQCWVKAKDLIDLRTLSDEDLASRGL